MRGAGVTIFVNQIRNLYSVGRQYELRSALITTSPN